MKPANNNEKNAADKCRKFLADKKMTMEHIAKGGSIKDLKMKGIEIAFPI